MCPGVVVIDDLPEVSIDDPSFLLETNEGFQEVVSRRTQKEKKKQKAALEVMKKSQGQQARTKQMDKAPKVQNITLSFASCRNTVD